MTPELLRFGERRGGAQFTCCTGTKVQILTPEVLQQEEYQEPVELRLLLQMDVALNEQLRAQEHRFSFFCVRRSTGSRSCARTRACHQDAVGAGISIARKPNVFVIYISTNIQATQVCGRRRGHEHRTRADGTASVRAFGNRGGCFARPLLLNQRILHSYLLRWLFTTQLTTQVVSQGLCRFIRVFYAFHLQTAVKKDKVNAKPSAKCTQVGWKLPEGKVAEGLIH